MCWHCDNPEKNAMDYLHAEPVPVHGERVCLVEGPCTEVVDVSHPDAYLLVAVNVYGEQVRAQQLVRADERGHWPWERGHRALRGGQPVLGARTAEHARMPASMNAWRR